MHQQLCTHLGDLALDLSHAAPLRNRHAERRPVQHRHAQRDLGDVAMAVITSLYCRGFALPRSCSAAPLALLLGRRSGVVAPANFRRRQPGRDEGLRLGGEERDREVLPGGVCGGLRRDQCAPPALPR